MIRMVYAIRRLPKLSREEFQGYWRDDHGPLAARHATAMRIRRYVQTHTQEHVGSDPLRPGMGTVEPYDGFAELWWNSFEELAAAAQTPEGQQASEELLVDERKFIDSSRSAIWFAVELPQINPVPEDIVARERSTIVKLVYVGNPRPGLSLEEGQLYWRMSHGPLVRSWAAVGRIRRYLQVHMLPSPFADVLRAQRGSMEEPYFGHAELWYDRLELGAAETTPERARARQIIAEDEAKFIDFSRSAIMVAKEHVLVER